MNKDNLNTLITLLESEKGAKRGVGFNMGDFLSGSKINGINETNGNMFSGTPCNTVACIAGHAAILAMPRVSLQHLYDEYGTGVRLKHQLGGLPVRLSSFLPRPSVNGRFISSDLPRLPLCFPPS